MISVHPEFLWISTHVADATATIRLVFRSPAFWPIVSVSVGWTALVSVARRPPLAYRSAMPSLSVLP
jgi:hypothetical protein